MTDTPTFAEVLSRAIPADGTTIYQMRAALWDTPAGRNMINNGDVVLYWLNEADVARAALAAAPQPVPDREALVEVIARQLPRSLGNGYEEANNIADALLARDLRLPLDPTMAACAACEDQPKAPNIPCAVCGKGAVSETMAWAVVVEGGKPHPSLVMFNKNEAERLCSKAQKERVVRVAIRVVEGCDDDAA